MSALASRAGGLRPVRSPFVRCWPSVSCWVWVIVCCGAWGLSTPAHGQVEPAPAGLGVELPAIDRTLVEPAVQDLLAGVPGLRVHRDGLGSTIFFGRPMTEDADADAAVDRFWARHATALGVLPEELSLEFVSPLSDNRATVYAYRLTPSGIEVEGAVARLLVWHDRERGLSQVTYAAARTALPSLAAAAVSESEVV